MRVQNAINSVPGVNIQLREVKGSFSGKAKDCCDPATGIEPNGIKEGKVTGELVAKLKDVQLWPPIPGTSFFKQGSVSAFGQIFLVEVVFQAGVFFNADLTLGAEGGFRSDKCDEAGNCAFGGATAGVVLELKATITFLACVDSTLTPEYCAGPLEFTPAALEFSVQGNLGFNQGACGDGFSGDIKVLQIVFKVTFAVPGFSGLTFSKVIFGGV